VYCIVWYGIVWYGSIILTFNFFNLTSYQGIFRLLEASQTICSKRERESPIAHGLLLDCSQKANRTSFRNEVFDNVPFVLDAEWARNMPKYGVVEFDFSDDSRPDRNDIVLADIKFVRLLVTSGMYDATSFNVL